jgi:FkbM family methyltransferase
VTTEAKVERGNQSIILHPMLSQKFHSLVHRLAPWLPSRLRLPFMAWAYSCSGWEKEVGWLKEIGPCRGMAIDVGANFGFYSLAMSSLYTKVVAFEPNKNVAAPLIEAALPNVEIVHAGVSSGQGTATLFVPLLNGVVMPGWASLDEQNCSGATELIQQEIPLRTLDSFQFEKVGFIKIDVEGHELEVLRGAAKTIQQDHPHLLIEVRDENLRQLHALLSEWGYDQTTLQSLGGPEGTPGNHLFVPRLLN